MKNVWVSYKKLPSGEWRIRFRSKGRPERGKNLPGSLREKTIKDKVAWYKEQIKMDYYNPWEEEQNSITINQAINNYLSAHKKAWSISHYNNVEWRLGKMTDYISVNAQIKRITSWDWFNDLNGAAAQTKKDYFSTTRAFLNWCKKNEYIDSFSLNLANEVVTSINRSEIKYITWEQLKALEQFYLKAREKTANYTGYSPERHTRLWWIMFWQVLRKEEAGRMKIEHIQLDEDRMKVLGKGGKADWIPITPPARPHIQWFLGNRIDDSLFGHSSMANPTKQLKNAFELKEFTDRFPSHHSKGFHQFRHGGAVHYLTQGVPLIFVSKLLRHENTRITSEVYADIIQGMEGSAFDDITDGPVK